MPTHITFEEGTITIDDIRNALYQAGIWHKRNKDWNDILNR